MLRATHVGYGVADVLCFRGVMDGGIVVAFGGLKACRRFMKMLIENVILLWRAVLETEDIRMVALMMWKTVMWEALFRMCLCE
jgi:hypothetical protein